MKKKELKPTWAVLGFLAFFALPAIALYLTSIIPIRIFKAVWYAFITLLVINMIIVKAHAPYLKKQLKFLEKIVHSWKSISFMHGLGIAFVLTIALFFGVIIWGIIKG